MGDCPRCVHCAIPNYHSGWCYWWTLDCGERREVSITWRYNTENQTNNVREPPTVTVTSTQSMFDASLIPTPTGMPPPPSGQFMLPLGIPQEQQKNCLTSAEQYNAWSCNVPPTPLYIDIHQPPSGFSVLKMWGQIPPDADGTKPRFNYTYGAQAPRVFPVQRLYWVSDLEEPARGPALHFQTNYDKLVILDPSQFGGRRKAKRSTTNGPSSDFSPPPPPPLNQPPPGHYRHSILQTGQQPWFCFWNQTFIEGFVYMGQNSSSGHGTKSPPAMASSTTTSGSPASFSLASTPGSPVVATPTPTSNKHDGDDSKPDDKVSSMLKRMAAAASNSAAAASSAAGQPSFPSPTGPLPPFPYIMKVEERRVPNSAAVVKPYCLKMIVPPDGQPRPMTDDDENPIRVELMENDPSPSEFSTAFSPKKTATPTGSHRVRRGKYAQEAEDLQEYFRRGEIQKRNDPPKSCHCLWVTPSGP
jgi:hypothetical protein